MAASMRSKLFHLKNLNLQRSNQVRIIVRTAFFDRFRKKDLDLEEELKREPVTFKDRFQGLKKRSGIQTTRAYKPPSDVEDKISSIASEVFGESHDLMSISLDDRTLKFQLLTRCQKELDHMVTNMDLTSMNNVQDVVTYFTTEVRDTCAYEDISKLDLPRNLHMNMEYTNVQLQSEPDNPDDEMFKEPVYDIKYKRKYKAHINKEMEVIQH